jgi:hypothetical protein
MPIPTPTAAESEQEFVSRCISEISGEYEQEQAAGICYSTYRQETKMSTQGKISSLLRQEAYKGIDLTKLAEGSLEDACWSGYIAIGTKILDGREVPNCVPEEKE